MYRSFIIPTGVLARALALGGGCHQPGHQLGMAELRK
jgi:hypothetical protein